MARTKAYPGSIRRRGETWQVRLCVAGEYSTHTFRGTKVEAQNFAVVKHAELERLAERQAEGLPGPLRFSALLAAFTEQELPGLAKGTRLSYSASFKIFGAYFVDRRGDPLADKVRRSEVKAFVAWRRVHSVTTAADGTVSAIPATSSPHTVARDLRVLKRLFNFAVEMEYVDTNPCARLKAPKADPRTPHILTADEYDRLLEQCEGRDMLHLFVLTCGETGARSMSEVLRLRWEDVDLSEGFIQIRSRAENRTKSGKSRWAPMSPRLQSALRGHAARYRLAMYDGARSPWLFHHTRSRTKKKAGERITNLRRAFKAAVSRADVPAIRIHDLRHRRVTTWLAEGKPAALVQEAMGHSSFATTAGYKHLAREHLRALVDGPEPPYMAKSMAK